MRTKQITLCLTILVLFIGMTSCINLNHQRKTAVKHESPVLSFNFLRSHQQETTEEGAPTEGAIGEGAPEQQAPEGTNAFQNFLASSEGVKTAIENREPFSA